MARAVIHSKTLQIIISKEDLVNLAHTGKATVQVTDVTRREFGECDIQLSDLARRACLEHLGYSLAASSLTFSAAIRRSLPKESG